MLEKLLILILYNPQHCQCFSTPPTRWLTTPCWTGVHRKWPRWFQFVFKNNRDKRRLIQLHHCSSSGMNLISTVRPVGETVANRHELCPRWRYGDSRLCYGVSQRTAGVAQTLAGRTTVWHGSSRWMPVKLRRSYGMTTVEAALRWFNYRKSIN